MNSYSGKNILITGGLGFIGSNLARALLSLGANVTLVDSLIPKYGGNIFNIHDIYDDVHAENTLTYITANHEINSGRLQYFADRLVS